MMNACRTTSLLLSLAVIAAACQRSGATSGAVLGDSTYVAAMAELQRIHDERVRTPMPPVPLPSGPNGSAPTAAGQRERDSLVRHRADSIVGIDSVKRAVIFAQFKVSVAALEETARSLSGDPARLLRVNDAIYRRVAALDAAANLAKTQGAKPAASAASPAPAKP